MRVRRQRQVFEEGFKAEYAKANDKALRNWRRLECSLRPVIARWRSRIVLLAQPSADWRTTSEICSSLPAKWTGLAPDHADGARRLRILEASDGHRRRARLDRHRHFRDQSHANAGTDHLHQRRTANCHPAIPAAAPNAYCRTTAPDRENNAPLPAEQPHFAQHFAIGHGLALILAGRTSTNLGKQRDFGQRRFGDRQSDDGRVEPAFRQFLNELRRQRLADMNIETGIHAREIADDRGQQIGRDRRDDADAQPPDQPVLRGARQIGQFIDRAQDVADAQRRTLRRNCSAEPGARLARTARSPSDFFQFLDLHRQGGLGDGAGIRRASKMSMSRQGLEIAKLLERQICHNHILSSQSENPT